MIPWGRLATTGAWSGPMTDKWYLANCIDGQIEFYKQGQEKNENAYQRLQLWSFVAGAGIAAASALAAVYSARFAAWTGALTTVGGPSGRRLWPGGAPGNIWLRAMRR